MSPSTVCPGCGQPLAPEVRFCEHCGRPIGPGAAPVPPAVLLNSPVAVRPPWVAPVVAFAALGLVAIVALVAVGAMRQRQSAEPSQAASETAASTQAATVAPDTARPPAAAADQTPDSSAEPLDAARTYLPKTGYKYLSDTESPDGDRGREVMTVGRPSENVLVSVVRVCPSDDFTIVFCEHYVQRADGVFWAEEEAPELPHRYLPDGLAVGKVWKSFDTTITVKAMNETVDLGFEVVHNVLLVRYDFDVDNWQEVYYAAGYGEILAKDQDGRVIQKLTKVAPVDRAGLAAVMAKHAKSGSQVH